MGVVVTDRQYNNRYTSEVVDFLLGNVGDWNSLGLTCRFGVEKISSQASPITIDIDNTLINTDGKDWNKFGFDNSYSVTLEYDIKLFNDDGSTSSTLHFSTTRNIVSVQGNQMKLDGADISKLAYGAEPGLLPSLPYQNGQFKVYNGIIWSDKKPEGIDIIYNHIENQGADSGSLNSFIDGTQSRIIALNTDTLTGFQFMDLVGKKSGMSIDSPKWIYWGKIGTHYYQYNLSFDFMLSSFFDDILNLVDNTPPDEVFNASSLTDTFIIRGYPKWNNPNVIMESDPKETKRLGNTGWFNENFNGLDNDFKIESVEYFDAATNTPISNLSYGSDTKVKAIISGVQNMDDGLSKYGLGFAWIPEDDSYYKNLDTGFHQNLKMNTCGAFNSGAHLQSAFFNLSTFQGFSNDVNSRMDVKDIRFSKLGVNLVYEATFSPTAGFRSFIEGLDEVDRNYLLWISVADRTLITNFSNRISLKLDYKKLDLEILPVGEWNPMTIDFFEHPNDGSINNYGSPDNFFIEDDILARIKFGIDINDPIPSAIEFKIEAERVADGFTYELQNYKIDLSTYQLDGAGVPQWNFDGSRGFKLESGNNKNWINVKRNQPLDIGGVSAYLANYGFKIRWEDWISRLGVPADFFDASEMNNGNNNDWLHYYLQATWKIKFSVYLDCTKDGAAVRYRNSKNINIRDYNDNANLIKTWSFFRESDNQQFPTTVDALTGEPLGVLLNSEHTLVKVKFERIAGIWNDLTQTYGTICIEVDKDAGQMEFRQLSSVYGSESDNGLIPIVGETKLKLTLLSPNEIEAECLVDPDLLLNATRYKLTARLGCLRDSVPVEINGFLFTQGDDVLDSNDNLYIVT